MSNEAHRHALSLRSCALFVAREDEKVLNDAADFLDTCQGWRSMETAPLDGKHCILSIQEGAFIVSVQGFYHGGKWIAVHRADVQPLAWMPNILLPAELCPPSFRNDALPTSGCIT